MQIKETEFYKICDKVDATIEPINEKLEKDGGIPYFPTVSELKEHHVEENVKKYLSFLIFLLTHVFKLSPLFNFSLWICQKNKKIKNMISIQNNHIL